MNFQFEMFKIMLFQNEIENYLTPSVFKHSLISQHRFDFKLRPNRETQLSLYQGMQPMPVDEP